MTATGDDYTITITPHGEGMRADVAGTSSMRATMDYWRRIAAWAREHDAGTLLLVDRLVGAPLTEADWLHLVTSMRGEGLEKLRIAHVKPQGLQEVEFCEIFARDSGIEARVFENETLAEVWLRYGEQ